MSTPHGSPFRRFVTGLSLVVLVALLLAPVAIARDSGRHFVDQRCTATLGFCWSTAYEGSNVALAMESSDHGGSYKVCVTSPRGEAACRPIKLHRRPPGPHGDAGYRSRVIFAKSFEFEGAGLYRVVWKGASIESPVSPKLYFRLGSDGKPPE
jgi:hypothetical protein